MEKLEILATNAQTAQIAGAEIKRGTQIENRDPLLCQAFVKAAKSRLGEDLTLVAQTFLSVHQCAE